MLDISWMTENALMSEGPKLHGFCTGKNASVELQWMEVSRNVHVTYFNCNYTKSCQEDIDL